MKRLLLAFLCIGAASIASAQSRPVQSYPTQFEMLIGTTSSGLDSILYSDGVVMRILPDTELNAAAIEFRTPYAGGSVMRLFTDTSPLPPSGSQEVLFYSFRSQQWVVATTQFTDFNSATPVTVPTGDYVNPRTGMVHTRIVWRFNEPVEAFEVDSVEWSFWSM